MLNAIIHFSIRNKFIVGLFTIALIIWGGYSFTQLPIDAVPDITNNQVQVITSVPSLGAADIERLVTFPIEQVNSNIPGLIELRSFSRFGLSLVTIVFDDDTDVYWARQQVAERLQIVKDQIPKGLGAPVLAPVTTGLGEIYQYVVKAKKGYESKFDITELRTIQDWIVRRQLLRVQGVADVSSFGGKLKQYEIAIDPNKLKSYGLTVSAVFSALENNNQNTGGAYIEKQATVLYIRSEGLITSLADIANIAVKNTENGTPLFIKDVAEVRLGNAIRYGAMTYNGEGEVCGAVVMMLKGANSSKVIKNVKDRIEQIKKILPEGVEIEPFLDRTKMVNNAIGTVEKNLMEGALIVVLVLVLFLGNFRAGILVASVIPLAMLFAVIMMNLFGVSGNLMSLGALDFGLIVDGAVIIVEAVMHQLHSKRFNALSALQQHEMDSEVKDSASRMMNSAVFGQIIILIVYLPIFSLQGIEGKMFKPMAQTVAFALLGAFILSLTYIPMMSSVFLSKKINHKKNISDKLMERIEHFYQSALEKVLGFPKMAVLSVVVLFTAAIVTLTFLGGEFIPALEEGDFAVDTRVLTGSNIGVSVNATLKGEKILLDNFPEVIKVVGKTGSGEVPTDPMPIEASDLMVILKDKSEWTSATTFNELAEKMGKALEAVPGVTFGFQYPVQMRFNELMTGARQDVVCKIFGENLDTLAYYAHKLGNVINTVDGSINLYVEAVAGMPQIVITYNRAAIAQYGLSISDVNKTINTAFAGQSTGLVYEDEKRFDLVVRMVGDQRKSISDVQNLLIASPKGDQVPLNQLAVIEIKEGPNQIQREDARRRIIVGFNVRGRDVQTIVNELQQKVEAKIKFPPGYFVTYGGAFENLNAAKQRLSIAVPVSLLLIFLMLFFAFNSVKQGLLIYTAIPLSAIGGIFALATRGMPFSISAGVGFIALFGVAVLNGIVLVAEFNRLKANGLTDLREIVISGTKVRLRPVLMTALVASLGFLPMALSNGAGAEVQRPLATVVIGGLLIATLLTLFILPVLYILFESGFSKKGKIASPVSVILFTTVLLSCFAQNAEAQLSISAKAAVDTALANNLRVKNERLKADYQKQLIKTGANAPQTNVVGEYGQVNSRFYDNRFVINQSINFPTVYSHQKSVLREEWRSSVLNVAVRELELKREVLQVFYSLLYLQEKKKLLEKNDSLYAQFLNKANLRFAAGESNTLEKTTAEIQRGHISIQYNQLLADLDLVQLQFQLLLNTTTAFIPKDEFKISQLEMPDTASIDEHPALELLLQQRLMSYKMTQLEKSRLLPDLSFTYNNMSMRGTGADNKFYYSDTRFQSGQVGIGIPIFYGAQKARINSSKAIEKISESNYEAGKQQLNIEYKKVLAQLNNFSKAVDYYEQTGLTNAKVITDTANKQFANGGINYLEWVMLINQAITIQTEYLNNVNSLNDSVIQLNYFITK